MLSTVKIDLSRGDLIKAIKAMRKSERDAFIEDLIASTSPEYLESIKEAKADYKAGRVKTHAEVFGE
ncbi:MAG: hypothetical protein NT010_13395 [Proteobacteria bacterium]|nr:hypothetical protein [Pseudomonadota bacterium]